MKPLLRRGVWGVAVALTYRPACVSVGEGGGSFIRLDLPFLGYSLLFPSQVYDRREPHHLLQQLIILRSSVHTNSAHSS